MLLDDDVVTDGKPKPGALSSRLSREERIEHLFFDLGRDTRAVVANPDLHTIAEALGRGSEGWLAIIHFRFALRRRVEAIRDQVEQRPRNLLREYIDLASSGIERPLQRDSEAPFLGPP
jgi:hypothetical protein